jgi:hypothetical protein
VIVFTVVAIGGVFAGSAVARFVSPSVLRRGFAVFLVAMGLFILYQNRAALTGAGEHVSALLRPSVAQVTPTRPT